MWSNRDEDTYFEKVTWFFVNYKIDIDRIRTRFPHTIVTKERVGLSDYSVNVLFFF